MKYFKNILCLFITFFFVLTCNANAESAKVTSMNYDVASSLVYINIEGQTAADSPISKFVRLTNPNRIYFDINDAVLIGAKQQLAFEQTNIKEIRLAQFSTEPNIVRAVVTFDENFDTSGIKIKNINGKVVLRTENPTFNNDYFHPIYDENSLEQPYSHIIAYSQIVQKTAVPGQQVQNPQNKSSQSVIDDINNAFANSTLNNSDGKTYDSIVSIDVSSDLKLRTKYFINGFLIKNKGLLINGLGQVSIDKIFTLESPKRLVIDLPNTNVDKKLRNKDINFCPDGSCKDIARIGQFECNKARIVITTDKPNKYIPIYSADAQSLLIINADKLDHTQLVNTVANIQKGFVRKINSKSNELILSFTAPVVHSIIRDDNFLTIYLFNVQSYNEADLVKIFNGTAYKSMSLSLLPQIGVKAQMKIKKDDVIQIAQSVDGKALRFIINSQKETKSDDKSDSEVIVKPKRTPIKNKVVIDPGHGGTDYGAIRDGINEKDITLDLSKKVAEILKSQKYKVSMTRNDDTYIGLQERCDFTESENPEIFVSIHVNSAVATEPNGIETHYYHEESKELAEFIQKNMVKNVNSKDRGILKSKFYVINHTDVPAVLVETGFLSNPAERAEIITDKRKQATAKAIADGITEYLKYINKKN